MQHRLAGGSGVGQTHGAGALGARPGPGGVRFHLHHARPFLARQGRVGGFLQLAGDDQQVAHAVEQVTQMTSLDLGFCQPAGNAAGTITGHVRQPDPAGRLVEQGHAPGGTIPAGRLLQSQDQQRVWVNHHHLRRAADEDFVQVGAHGLGWRQLLPPGVGLLRGVIQDRTDVGRRPLAIQQFVQARLHAAEAGMPGHGQGDHGAVQPVLVDRQHRAGRWAPRWARRQAGRQGRLGLVEQGRDRLARQAVAACQVADQAVLSRLGQEGRYNLQARLDGDILPLERHRSLPGWWVSGRQATSSYHPGWWCPLTPLPPGQLSTGF